MAAQQQNCLKCGKPKEKGTNASITQWMSSCNCDLILNDEESTTHEFQTCQSCGKRVEQGRAGSFTQWIFRSDLCCCDKPAPVLVKQSDSVVQKDQNLIPETEIQIEVDSQDFPLDRYKPLRQLGAGASGAIYLCRDRLLNSKVAVKVLRVINADQLISFQQEARATSKLTHPNIVKVLNFGASENGAPFMVMDCFAGSSLEFCIDEHGPLPEDIALHIFSIICDALESAHQQGIYHRDIKSSNILVSGFDSPFPDVRLIDFGIALVKHAHQDPTEVQGITVVGTPAYMAPDQVRGRPYDARSEVYAMGCVLFEALTGRPPFICDTALETFNMHASQEPPWLADVHPEIEYSEALELLVAKCLAKDPNDRFQSMRELKLACQAVSTGISTGLDATGTFGGDRSDRKTTNLNATTIFIVGSASVMILFAMFAIPAVMSLFEKPVHRKPARLQSKQGKHVSTPSELARTALYESIYSDERRTEYSKSDFSLTLTPNLSDESLNSVPENAVVERLVITKGSYTRTGLFKFASRPNVRLTSLRIYSFKNCDLELSAICSAPNTKLRGASIIRCGGISTRAVESLAKEPLQSLVLQQVKFENDSLNVLFRKMDKSRLTNLWLTKVEPLSEAPFKQLGKFQELKDCQIVDKRIPDTVFEQLAKLRKLEMLYLSGEAEIEPKCFNRLERIRGLRGFGVGKSLLSSSQLKIVLQNQKKPPVLTLAGREHLIDDLEVARLAGITYLSIRDAIITSEIVEKLKQLKLNYLLIDLQGTSTSNSIIQELKKSIPGVNFNYSEYEMPT